MVPLSMTLSELWPGFQGHDILKSNVGKTPRVKDKLLFHTNRKLYLTWNGTIFGDLEWPLNASRGFVSISWASYCHYTAIKIICTWWVIALLAKQCYIQQFIHKKIGKTILCDVVYFFVCKSLFFINIPTWFYYSTLRLWCAKHRNLVTCGTIVGILISARMVWNFAPFYVHLCDNEMLAEKSLKLKFVI